MFQLSSAALIQNYHKIIAIASPVTGYMAIDLRTPADFLSYRQMLGCNTHCEVGSRMRLGGERFQRQCPSRKEQREKLGLAASQFLGDCDWTSFSQLGKKWIEPPSVFQVTWAPLSACQRGLIASITLQSYGRSPQVLKECLGSRAQHRASPGQLV